ncbi:MAG: co-chaperone GroES, partial [Parcubacteria group bacterium]
KPLNDHIIVKATPDETKTAGGIILPDTADKQKPEKGEVIAVGPGRLMDNGQRAFMSVIPGDKVVFKSYSANEIKLGEEEYLVLGEADILAIIE